MKRSKGRGLDMAGRSQRHSPSAWPEEAMGEDRLVARAWDSLAGDVGSLAMAVTQARSDAFRFERSSRGRLVCVGARIRP